MAVPSRSALYGFARLVRLVSTLVVVGIIAYVAFAAYSAVVYHPTASSLGTSTSTTFSGSQIVEGTTVSLSNPGYFSLSSLQLESTIRLPNGTVLSTTTSPAVNLNAHSNVTIPVAIVVPIGGAAQVLLTQDELLNVTTQLTTVYASLFDLTIGFVNTFSWGAPFYGLSVQAGTPVTEPNGTIVVPVTATWMNHASLTELGTLHITVVSASGVVCGHGNAAVSVPGHSAGSTSTNVTLKPGCNPSGGMALLTFTGPGGSFPLPSQRIP